VPAVNLAGSKIALLPNVPAPAPFTGRRGWGLASFFKHAN
jgi:hypothetical protein